MGIWSAKYVYMKINEVIAQKIKEQATAGATSAGNIATLNNPHVAAGPDRFKKSYTGSPGRSGTKAPNVHRNPLTTH